MFLLKWFDDLSVAEADNGKPRAQDAVLAFFGPYSLTIPAAYKTVK
jgi:hypothetical protein